MKMNKKFLTIFVLGIIVSGSLIPSFAHAQEGIADYTVLAPLPGTTKCDDDIVDENGKPATDCETDLKTYLEGFFDLAIGISAAFAVVMIVLGGFQYMTTDAVLKKTEGTKKIKNALLGLGLVIASWLILSTIGIGKGDDPGILSFSLEIKPVDIKQKDQGELGIAPTPLKPEEVAESNRIRQELEKDKVYTYAPPCEGSKTTGCVNLNGLTDTAKSGLVELRKACGNVNCVMITGGTEGGHSTGSTHNTGNGVDIDARSELNYAIKKNGVGAGGNGYADLQPCTTVQYGSGTYLWEPAGSKCGGNVASSGSHWHVTYK